MNPHHCPHCRMPFTFLGQLTVCPVCKHRLADTLVGLASCVVGIVFAVLIAGGFA